MVAPFEYIRGLGYQLHVCKQKWDESNIFLLDIQYFMIFRDGFLSFFLFFCIYFHFPLGALQVTVARSRSKTDLGCSELTWLTTTRIIFLMWEAMFSYLLTDYQAKATSTIIR
jgi:hypothetical protein